MKLILTENRMKNLCSKILSLAVVGLGVLVAHPSHTLVVWEDLNKDGVNDTNGQIEELTTPFYPAFLSEAPYPRIPRSYNLRVFNEFQNVVLPREIEISKINPNYVESEAFANYDSNINVLSKSLAYDWDDLMDLPTLPAGTRVSSHLIVFYVPHLLAPFVSRINRTDAAATITFDGTIVGLMGDPCLINKTNDLFSPTSYRLSKEGTLEGLKWRDIATRDYLKITGSDNNVLELRWTSTSRNLWNLEVLRVLTVATPSTPTVVSNETDSTFLNSYLIKPSKECLQLKK